MLWQCRCGIEGRVVGVFRRLSDTVGGVEVWGAWYMQ